MPYPSTVSAFTNPAPTDKLSSPSHSGIESAQNTGLTELMTFVGTLASTAGTLIYDIRSSVSSGGGHIQTANVGGTGQTAYTKGDVLVATSSSVLSKLAVGANDLVLVADSSQAAGVKWGGGATQVTKSFSAGENLASADAVVLSSVPVTSGTLQNTHATLLASASSQCFTAADSASLSVTTTFTIEGWLKLTSSPTSGNYMILVGKYTAAGSQRAYQFGYNNAAGTFKLSLACDPTGDTSGLTESLVTKTLTEGTWHHLAVTHDSSGNVKFYVNGVQEGTTQTSAANAFDSTAIFVIGATSAGTASFVNGSVDDVRLWNSVRTVTEIADNYKIELVGTESNLQGYWKLNNGLTDSTANANTLTNVGVATFTSLPNNLPFNIGNIYKTVPSIVGKYEGFIGFTSSVVSAGTATNVVMAGVYTGFGSVLTAGGQYYLSNTAGLISSVAGINTRKVGIATASTDILITNIW